MGLNEKDKQHLDRWHRAEGTAKPPKRTSAPENNLNPMTHGIWANQCLNDEERELFREILQRLWNDFEFNKSSNFLQVELVAVYSVKIVMAQINGDMDASEKLDRMIRCLLKDLKATKIAREGEAGSGPETTPAEWATALLEKLAEAQKTNPQDSGLGRPKVAPKGGEPRTASIKPARKSAKKRKTRK